MLKSTPFVYASQLILALFLITFHQSAVAPTRACGEYLTQMETDNISEGSTECHKDKSKKDGNNREKWYSPPTDKDSNSTKNQSKRPRFKVHEYNECAPGLENLTGCDSNPDVKPCPDGTYPIILQIYTLDGKYLTRQNYCPGDPPPSGLSEDEIERQAEVRITPEKFRSYPIKGSKIQSTPNKFSLRNGHTHFWASNETQEFKSEISEADVRIKAIPIQWNWNYGDGATRNLNFPGEAMPSHTLREETKTSHAYTKTGKFGVRVTTLYRGEFSVDGGPWQAIPGQAAVPSNTLPMDVWRTKKELIAND